MYGDVPTTAGAANDTPSYLSHPKIPDPSDNQESKRKNTLKFPSLPSFLDFSSPLSGLIILFIVLVLLKVIKI